MKIVNRAFRLEEFQGYLNGIAFNKFRPSVIVIHHTAAPSLAMRPKGFESQHMLNIKDFYEGKGWSAGPHLFIDEDQSFVFTPLNERGVHAVAFNKNGLGIEMLGDYDLEDPWSGRGLKVLQMTANITRILLAHLNLKKDAVRFHRDDPHTSKSCPGKKISKKQFLELI